MNVKEQVCSIKELHKAMMKCKKGVSWKDSVATFTNHGLVRCYKLKHSLLDGTYRISKYIQFQVHEPKTRNIVSTRFVDRVFQRSLCDNYLTHEIQKDFIEDNYACQVGKGNHKAVKALLRHLHNYWKLYGTQGYILSGDIHDYFGSTRHDVAKESTSYVRDEWAKSHLYLIIDSFVQGENPEVGMGLGSQVTQSIQLAVLHPLDKAIKREARIKFYLRYMDDFKILHEDKAYLRNCLKSINHHLNSKGLTLNDDKTTIQKVSQPVHFLGYSYQLQSNGKVTMKVLPKKMASNRRKLRKMVLIKRLSKEECDKTLEAILAHIKKANNRSQVTKMVNYYKKLWEERENVTTKITRTKSS